MLLRRSATLMVGEGAARILGIVLYGVLARLLGVSAFGILSSGMSAALMVATLIDLGQTAHANRTVASEPAAAGRTLRVTVENKALLTLLAIPLLGGVLRAAGFSATDAGVAMIMAAWVGAFGCFESARAVARSLGHFALDTTANALESLLRVVVVVSIAVLGGGLVGASFGFVLEAVIALIVLWLIGTKSVWRHGEPRGDAPTHLAFLRAAAPIGIGAAALAVYYRLDQVLVLRIAGASANGVYAAAARAAFTANVASQLVTAAVFPRLAADREDPVRYAASLRKGLALCTAVSALVSGMLALAARPIIALLYGESFAAAVPLLRVLAISVLFNGLSTLFLYSAVALKRERRSLVVAAVATAAIAVAYTVSIARFGAAGAAWTSAVSEAFLAGGLFWVSRDRIRLSEPVMEAAA